MGMNMSSGSSGPAYPYAATQGLGYASELNTMTSDMFNNLILGQEMPLIFGEPSSAFTPVGGAGNYTMYGAPSGSAGEHVFNTSPWAGSPSPMSYTNPSNPMGSQVNPLDGSNFANFGAPGAILHQAFDPHNAQYNLEASQLRDQTGSALSQSGLANTPLGAAVGANTMGTFDIGYESNLLNQEEQGLASALGAYQSATGSGAQSAAPLSSGASTAANIAGIQKSQQQSAGVSGLGGIGGLMGK